LYLIDSSILLFRQTYFQGLLECFVVLLLQQLIAGYTRQWLFVYNINVLFALILLRHFKSDYHVISQKNRMSLTLYAVLLYTGMMYWLYGIDWYLCHFDLIFILFESVATMCPGCFTVSELFTLLSILANYVIFGLKSVLKANERVHVAGNNTVNAFIFLPLVMLTLFLLILTLLRRFSASKSTSALVSVTGTLIATSLLYKELPVLSLTKQVVFDDANIWLLTYMSLCLAVCLPTFAILGSQLEASKNTVRKLFHALAFVLFLPGLC